MAKETNKYDEDYLNSLIAKATKSWEGIDVDSYMSELRGYLTDKEVAEKEQEALEDKSNGGIIMTIEERADAYVGHPEEIDEFTTETIKRDAYIRGAKEQKAIDDAEWLKIKSSWEREAQINHNDENNYKQGFHDAIEKACDWLKENIEGGVHPQSIYGFVKKFRKAMEEKL